MHYPILFKENLDLNQKFIEFFIKNKNLFHIEKFLKDFQTGFLFNCNFFVKNYHLKDQTVYNEFLKKDIKLFGMGYKSDINPTKQFVMPYEEVVKENFKPFYYQFDNIFKSNGFMIYYSVKNENLVKINFPFYLSLLEESNDFFKKTKDCSFNVKTEDFIYFLNFVINNDIVSFKKELQIFNLNLLNDKIELLNKLNNKIELEEQSHKLYLNRYFMFLLGIFCGFLINLFFLK